MVLPVGSGHAPAQGMAAGFLVLQPQEIYTGATFFLSCSSAAIALALDLSLLTATGAKVLVCP